MRQTDLPDHHDAAALTRSPRGIALSALTHSASPPHRAQKQFNALLAKIEAQREELEAWKALMNLCAKRISEDIHPLQIRYRERQIAVARLLDRAIDGGDLSRVQHGNARRVLIDMLVGLIKEQEDVELIRLHDQHAAVSFEEDQRLKTASAKAMADAALGIDPGFEHGLQKFEKLHCVNEAQIEADEAEHAEQHQPGSESKPVRQRGAKALANEAARAQAAQDASHAAREIYRKLVSELHPDREPAPAERERKTALMQRVNQAYVARDLLALLELQLSVEQIDTAALANVAQDRLVHYNALLRKQAQALTEEVSEVKAPFLAAFGGRLPREAAADFVLRTLDADARHLKQAIRAIDDELARFSDIRQLKASLKHRCATRGRRSEFGDIETPDAAAPRRRRSK